MVNGLPLVAGLLMFIFIRSVGEIRNGALPSETPTRAAIVIS